MAGFTVCLESLTENFAPFEGAPFCEVYRWHKI